MASRTTRRRAEGAIAGAAGRNDVPERDEIGHPSWLVVVQQATVGRTAGMIPGPERQKFGQRGQLRPGPQMDGSQLAADGLDDAPPPRADPLAAGVEIGDRFTQPVHRALDLQKLIHHRDTESTEKRLRSLNRRSSECILPIKSLNTNSCCAFVLLSSPCSPCLRGENIRRQSASGLEAEYERFEESPQEEHDAQQHQADSEYGDHQEGEVEHGLGPDPDRCPGDNHHCRTKAQIGRVGDHVVAAKDELQPRPGKAPSRRQRASAGRQPGWLAASPRPCAGAQGALLLPAPGAGSNRRGRGCHPWKVTSTGDRSGEGNI